MSEGAAPWVVPAVLGWSNATTGPESVRLYAADVPSPRWHGTHGRVVEQALQERGSDEGDRYLIVHLGDRFTSDEFVARVTDAIAGVGPVSEMPS